MPSREPRDEALSSYPTWVRCNQCSLHDTIVSRRTAAASLLAVYAAAALVWQLLPTCRRRVCPYRHQRAVVAVMRIIYSRQMLSHPHTRARVGSCVVTVCCSFMAEPGGPLFTHVHCSFYQ